ncbi:MAG: hypothetical protein J7K31_02660 [Candidatus Aenigmarchaeota archaeon]|nr:hypothetical protein [Candidatus Aenigmarchaeota archaeon]
MTDGSEKDWDKLIAVAESELCVERYEERERFKGIDLNKEVELIGSEKKIYNTVKELCQKYPKGVTPTQVKRKYEKMYGEKKSTRLIAHFLHQLNIYGFLNEDRGGKTDPKKFRYSPVE